MSNMQLSYNDLRIENFGAVPYLGFQSLCGLYRPTTHLHEI